MKNLKLCIGADNNTFKIPGAYMWKQFGSKDGVVKLTEGGAPRLLEQIMLKMDNIGHLKNCLVVVGFSSIA